MSAEGLTEEIDDTNSKLNESIQLLNKKIIECEKEIDSRCDEMIQYINLKRISMKQKLQNMQFDGNQSTIEINYNFKVIPNNYNANELDVILIKHNQDINVNDDDSSSRTPDPSPVPQLQYHRYMTRDKINKKKIRRNGINKKKFCGYKPVPEPTFLKQLKDTTLNPTDLEPRLRTKGSYGFVPDRRGISQIYTSCNASNNADIINCIKRIERFVLNQAPLIPHKITSRVNNLYKKHVGSYYKQTKMHWHIHYDRTDWISIIEKNKMMDIFADDMNEKEFMQLLDIIDVFKYAFSKRGWMEKKQQLLSSNNISNNIKKNDIIIKLKKYGFTCCKNKLRLIKPIENVRNIKKELLMTIKLIKEIYQTDGDYDDAFKDMRFGLDIQKKNAFIEIRKDLFFSMSDINDNMEINSFIKLVDIKMSCKFIGWLCKINTRINDQERVNELLTYCQKYFDKYPQCLYWHKNHH